MDSTNTKADSASAVAVSASAIPEELRERRQWVLWKVAKRRSSGKPTKLPYQLSGELAASNDPSTWCDFASAHERYQRGGYAGIGFMFAADDPYCGIDLDGCRNPTTGEVADWAERIIKQCSTYIEVSPSRTGVKVFARGKLPSATGKKREVKNAPWAGPKRPAIEVYDHGRYFAVTGHALPLASAELRDCQAAIDAIWVQHLGPKTVVTSSAHGQHRHNGHAASAVQRCRKYVAKLAPAIEGEGGHDATFLVACECYRFGLSDSDASAVLSEYNACCKPPWSDGELRHKLGDARARVLADGEYGSRLTNSATDRKPSSGLFGNPASKPILVQSYSAFPVAALPSIIGDYISAAARSIGCDAAFVALPLLAALAAAIGNSRRIALKRNWQEPCILWTAIVGDSGTHKTPALSLATSILSHKQDEALAAYESRRADYERNLLIYEAELAAWKRSKRDTRGEPPEKPDEPIAQRYIVSDTTVEALADRLQHAPRGLLLERDELAGWLRSFDQYKGGKGGDTAHWLTLYNAKSLRIDRKTAAQKLINVRIASVSIAGGIQPETLRRALGREHFENGLAARLLLAYPPKLPRQWSEATVSETLERELAGVFSGLLALEFGMDENRQPTPIELPLTPEARTAWIDFYNRHGGEQNELAGNEAALWSKLEGTAPRLALIVQLVRDAASMAVDEVSMAAGITLADWFGQEGRRVYGVLGESDEERDRRQLVELIDRHGGSITANDLRRRSRRYSTSDDAEEALDSLANGRFGAWESVATTEHGGRPTRRLRLAGRASVSETPSNPDERAGLGYSDGISEAHCDDADAINRALENAAEEGAPQF